MGFIVVANGLADNTMVAAQKSNLFFNRLTQRSQRGAMLDIADLDGSKNVGFIMRYTAGVQYGVASDIVYYGA